MKTVEQNKFGQEMFEKAVRWSGVCIGIYAFVCAVLRAPIIARNKKKFERVDETLKLT